MTPLDRFLKSNATDLILFGWVKGAQHFTANGVATNKLIRAFLDRMGMDMDENSAKIAFYRMDEKFREVEKSAK